MIRVTNYTGVTRYDLARTIAGRGRYWTTAYRVGDLLIDSGCAHTAAELLAALAPAWPTRLIITHSHEDHIGANGPLQRRNPHLKIHAHPGALPVLAAPRALQPLQAYRRVFWGYPEPSEAIGVNHHQRIEIRDHSFQVIFTPGHSPDHLCLYEPDQGWLFSGDLFVGGRERALRAEYSIWEIIASLKTIAALPLRWLFPGCARVREQPAEALRSKIDYLESLGQEVIALHETGRSVHAIARELLGGPKWIEWVTRGHFSRRALVASYLRQEGRDLEE
jgi:glyoxylase-like metal-dependent hydrolase (beta-lactamase superfamily II)